ncbi:MAG: VanZ family protein [Deltaproteobacteria bacterium]|nr:VanZ family protein [Deltaproteobacteria bacterium]
MKGSWVRPAGLMLAIATLLIAIVVTQWPFDYRITTFAVRMRWNRIEWSWFPPTYGGSVVTRDLVQNLVMLMPLGIGFGMWRRAARMRVAIEGLALGIVTGTALEVAQLVTRSRYTSFPDLWNNAVGCLLGCLFALAIQRALEIRRP